MSEVAGPLFRILVEPQAVEAARENNPNGDDLRAKAAAWIDANPVAYARFERFALEAARSGRHFGIGLLTERVRWEALVRIQQDEDGYRINNNHRAYIARKLIADHPQLDGLIRFRKTRW